MRWSWFGERAENARRTAQTSLRLSVGLVMSTTLFGVAPARGDTPDETIVIVDTAPPRPAEDNAASASVITADRTPRSAETMPDLLDDLPGVTVSRLGGIGSPALLSLRGSTWE